MFLFFLGGAVFLGIAAFVGVVLFRRYLKRAQALEKRARDSERMAYVGSLAGGLAHEIRNPLSTLSLNLQLLREDWKRFDQAPRPGHVEGGMESPQGLRPLKRLDVLQREARRLEEILNDFLRYARGGQLELENLQVNDLIREVLEFIGPEAQANKVDILTSLDEQIPPVPLDADLFKQALLNIILNAEQAMPTGGQLLVQSRRLKDSFQMDITDTGTGIPPDVTTKVFDVYFSTKRGGTGLGLATTRRIIEEHGGSITFETELGKGTNFRVLVPYKRP